MLRNFSNGVFAMGIFVGVIICIFLNPIVNFFGWELSVWSNETLQGVMVGGGVTVLATYWSFHQQSRVKTKRVATALQIKLYHNLRFTQKIKANIQGAKSKLSQKDTSPNHYLFHLLRPLSNHGAHIASAEELALVMELLRHDQKNNFIEIWMLFDHLEKLFSEIHSARQSALNEAGLPQSMLLLIGANSIKVGDLSPLNNKLAALEPFVDECSSQCDLVLDRTFDLLMILQDQLAEKAGVKPDFFSLTKIAKPDS